MEAISVFDMLKIGVGPSSSHTLGPWRAAEAFVAELHEQQLLTEVAALRVHLYGSLALTGVGHGTDIAIMMGLSGKDPVTVPVEEVQLLPRHIRESRILLLGGTHELYFESDAHFIYHFSVTLDAHANGMRIQAIGANGSEVHSSTYYSIGGGFILKEGQDTTAAGACINLPFPIQSGAELLSYCTHEENYISDIVYKNELQWRSRQEIDAQLWKIWETMRDCVYRGCHTEGTLPGGLDVSRRAAAINRRLLPETEYEDVIDWMASIREEQFGFSQIIKWIGCFAMAVNEENASFGRIVTAPTNGASGVIPAVLYYYYCFSGEEVSPDDIRRFLLVAGEIGSIFKKGSTISAAMGGCQAEIGVSSAMAAAGLAERLGATAPQVLMAAEIAMEHHLGLTCDPVGGLVQVPCIERNSMGAVKAITAAKIALESDPAKARVSLDQVVKTMWETAQDMNSKYKETSQGGLAANIAISVPEC